MNLDIALQIASIVLTVLLAGIGVEMANNPPAKDDKALKWKYRTAFTMIGLLLIGANYWQSVRGLAEQTKIKTEATKEQEKLETRIGELKSQNDEINGRLIAINNFVQHPPPSLSTRQVAESVKTMAEPSAKQIQFEAKTVITEFAEKFADFKRHEAEWVSRNALKMIPNEWDRFKANYDQNLKEKVVKIHWLLMGHINNFPATGVTFDVAYESDLSEMTARQQLKDLWMLLNEFETENGLPPTGHPEY